MNLRWRDKETVLKGEHRMKILFVCIDRYPYDGACTNLLKKLFFEGGMIELEYDIHIATYKHFFHDKALEIFDGITVHRLLSPYLLSAADLMKHFYRCDLLIRGGTIKLQEKANSRSNADSEIREGQIREYEKFLYQLCKKEYFDIVIGVAASYEMAIAAKNVSLELKIPYVLYQVDPFTDNETFSKLSVNYRLQLETELYKSANKVFTTELILSQMRKRIDAEILSKVEVMEFPGVSVELTQNKNQTRKSEHIECVFAGRVYKRVRNPSFTIELFRRLPKHIFLKLYGVSEKELKELFSISLLPSNIECYGLVSVDEAENAIRNADVLVNIGNIMLNQVQVSCLVIFQRENRF